MRIKHTALIRMLNETKPQELESNPEVESPEVEVLEDWESLLQDKKGFGVPLK